MAKRNNIAQSGKKGSTYTSTPIEDLIFVYDNFERDDISRSDCPSAGAWSMLKRLQPVDGSNPEAALMREERVDEFLTKIFPRVALSKSQVEEALSYQDKGQSCKDTIQKLHDKFAINEHLSKSGFSFEAGGTDE